MERNTSVIFPARLEESAVGGDLDLKYYNSMQEESTSIHSSTTMQWMMAKQIINHPLLTPLSSGLHGRVHAVVSSDCHS